jgi:hypothetical protein
MRTLVTTILMACALLGVGCSDSEEPDVPTPAPTATVIQKTEAELKKEAEDRAEMKPRKDAAVQGENAPVTSPTP